MYFPLAQLSTTIEQNHYSNFQHNEIYIKNLISTQLYSKILLWGCVGFLSYVLLKTKSRQLDFKAMIFDKIFGIWCSYKSIQEDNQIHSSWEFKDTYMKNFYRQNFLVYCVKTLTAIRTSDNNFINELVTKNTSSKDDQLAYDYFFILMVSKYCFYKLNDYDTLLKSIIDLSSHNQNLFSKIHNELSINKESMKKEAYKYILSELKHESFESSFIDSDFLSEIDFDVPFTEFWTESVTGELEIDKRIYQYNILYKDFVRVRQILESKSTNYNIEEIISPEAQEILFYNTWKYKGSIHGVHNDFGRMSFNGSLDIPPNYHCNDEDKYLLLANLVEILHCSFN